MNLASDLTTYGRDLHRFLDRLPAQLKNANTPESARQIAELERGCERLLREAPRPDPTARWAQAWSKVQMRLSELNQALRAFKTQDIAQVRSLTKSKALAREYVLAHYTETARAYEAWLMQWSTPAQQRPQSLRTLRAARTWFHIAMGVFAAVMYQFVIDKTQALIILYTLGGIFGTLEVTRRFSQRWNEILVSTVFKAISRPGEFHKTNSATYYLFALCLITTFFDRAAVITGILVLAFGDPAAAWVGKRFGGPRETRAPPDHDSATRLARRSPSVPAAARRRGRPRVVPALGV